MPENKNEKEVKEVSKSLNISLPFGGMPILMKIIFILTSVGGLSIIASIFTDIVKPQETMIHFYLLRLATGVLMLMVGYGIVKKKRWAIWLYGGVSIISFYVNPVIAFLPLCITVYLYFRREYFTNGTLKDLGKEVVKGAKKINKD